MALERDIANPVVITEANEELGAMQLSEAQTVLLKFLYERFPTPYRETGEAVKPRAKHQPPTRQEALDTLGIEPPTWDDAIAILSAHELVREEYWHGTKEYENLTLAPGHAVRVPVARGNPPADADPTDERFGILCYQITARGIQILKNSRRQVPRPPQ